MIPNDEEFLAYQRNVEISELREQILQLVRGYELNPTELMSLLLDVFSELQPRVPSVVDLARQNDESDSGADAASQRYHIAGEGRPASEVIAQMREMLTARRRELEGFSSDLVKPADPQPLEQQPSDDDGKGRL